MCPKQGLESCQKKKNINKLKEKDKAAFYSPAEEWVLPAASTKEAEEREFVVDSGASTIRRKTNSNDFGGFWNSFADSNSNFVVAKNNIFERLAFLVRSKFSHVQRDCTCACAVACLCPQNSNSNVVVSVTIHDDTH